MSSKYDVSNVKEIIYNHEFNTSYIMDSKNEIIFAINTLDGLSNNDKLKFVITTKQLYYLINIYQYTKEDDKLKEFTLTLYKSLDFKYNDNTSYINTITSPIKLVLKDFNCEVDDTIFSYEEIINEDSYEYILNYNIDITTNTAFNASINIYINDILLMNYQFESNLYTNSTIPGGC